MERVQKNQITGKLIRVSIIYLTMLVSAVVMLLIRKIDHLLPEYTLSIGVDLFGMPVGLLLAICTVVDQERTGKEQAYFRPMVDVIFIGLYTDMIALIVDGIPELAGWNIAVNTINLMCIPTGFFIFHRFLLSIFPETEGRTRTIDRIMLIAAIISVIIILLNVFMGFYFHINADGYYERGPLYKFMLGYVILAVVLTANLIIFNRKRLSFFQFISLIVFLIAPIVVLILSREDNGLTFQYGIMMLDMIEIYCAVNINEGRKKAAIRQDIAMAAQIQQSVLPKVFPPFPDRTEFELYASMDPAKDVGGDFYDFFLIDDDHLCMIIGDVSGKGVTASLFMMSSRTIIHNTAKTGALPETILRISNEEIMETNSEQMFVTVWLGILEISTGILKTSSAGHEYPAVRQAEGEYALLKDRHGIPLGVMKGMIYPPTEIRMKAGDSIFVYTDGAPEAENTEKKQFGTDRMLAALNGASEATPEQTLANVQKAIDGFVQNAEQFDDLTMLCLNYNGNEHKQPEGTIS